MSTDDPPRPETIYPVAFVGAGPGDPGLITVKGRRLLKEADLVIYTGSLIPSALVRGLKATIFNSAGMTLEEVISLITKNVLAGKRVVRLHTGDPTLYSTIHEQIHRLRLQDIPFFVVPGVTAGLAAAASLGRELTVPGISQTVIFSRASGRTPVPAPEELEKIAALGASLILYLSVGHIEKVQKKLLTGGYGPETPVAVLEKVSWPEERTYVGRLKDLKKIIEDTGIKKTAVILVGDALRQDSKTATKRSLLYHPGFSHGYRRADPERMPHLEDRPASPITLITYITPGGKALAEKVARHLGPGSHPKLLSYKRIMAKGGFKRYWARGNRLIFIMAVGIVVRVIAPLIGDKFHDPAVVVMDESRRNVISLLSGHIGGANRLAIEIAKGLGMNPVITTASDALGLVSLDLWVRHQGLVPDSWEKVKTASAHIVAHGSADVFVDPIIHVSGLPHGLNLVPDREKAHVIISPFLSPPASREILRLYPRIFALGLGCNRGTSTLVLERAVEAFLARHHISRDTIFCISTIDAKRDERCITALARDWKMEVVFFPADELNAVPLEGISIHALKAVGASGVAEPSAILAAGKEAMLYIKKEKTRDVTMALAARQFILETEGA